MKKAGIYRYPLRLEKKDKQDVEKVVRASGRTINQVLTLSVRKGLPLAREALCAEEEQVTNVNPLSDVVWRKIYSQVDEVDESTASRLREAQSQSEPQ